MFNITESNAARYFRCADRASRLLSEGYKIVEVDLCRIYRQ